MQVKKYFSEIGNKLKAIENAYRNQYLTAGTLIGEQFLLRGVVFLMS